MAAQSVLEGDMSQGFAALRASGTLQARQRIWMDLTIHFNHLETTVSHLLN